MGGSVARNGWTQEDIEWARPLLPFLSAARRGLKLSRWRPGMGTDELLAPIVLAVLAEVGRSLPSSSSAAATGETQ